MSETSATVAAAQLRSFFERWQRLEEEKANLAGDLKELFAEAKGNGYDTKTMRVVFRDKMKDQAEMQEAASMYDLYWSALDQPKAPARPAYSARENIEQFPHSSAPTSSPVKTDDSPALPPSASGSQLHGAL